MNKALFTEFNFFFIQVGTYTAAVVEITRHGEIFTARSVMKFTHQLIQIIKSSELNAVDILVMPESILNRATTAPILPKTNSYCDDAKADIILRSISCAVRQAKKYVVINLYVKIKCSDDDQSFCSNEFDSTNLYNMAIVFDRHGDVIAK